jgi:hypothetical protein
MSPNCSTMRDAGVITNYALFGATAHAIGSAFWFTT